VYLGKVYKRTLTVIGVHGSFQIDRTSYKCQGPDCGHVLDYRSPLAYISRYVLPVTLAASNGPRTVLALDLAKLFHRLRRSTPGISSTALAGSLPTEMNPKVVRPVWIDNGLLCIEDMEAAFRRSCDGASHKHFADKTRFLKTEEPIGVDVSEKVSGPHIIS
jgi:hypothetical protein